MKRKTLALTFVMALLFSFLFHGSLFQPVGAQSFENIFIRADGSVEGTDKIHRDGDVYTLTGNISGGIHVQKSYVVIDGASYTVQGSGNGRGIDLSNNSGEDPSRLRVNNVTIKNIRIINFDHGIDNANSYNNTFIGNYVTNCSVGIWLIGSENSFANNTITLNTIENNTEGIHIDYSGKNNVVTENNLINNDLIVFLSPQPTVDRNYWSDYLTRYPNAKELGNSGFWDTPYDRKAFIDNHPLVKPVSNQWLPALNIMSFEEAVEAVNKQDITSWNVSSSLTGQPDHIFADDTGFSGYLIWLAPNGTYYEAEFPTGNLLGEIGYLHGENSWNPPEGFYIWHLNYEDINAYWVLAHNGTIVRAYTLRGGGPAVQPFSEIVFYGLIAAIVAVGLGLLIYFTKLRKKSGKK